MSPRHGNPPDHLRIELAHSLGYDQYPNDLSGEPYLNYIANRYVGRGTFEEYLSLFIRVVKHFSKTGEKPATTTPKVDSIHALINQLTSSDSEAMFLDTNCGCETRKEAVKDTVMYIIGTWAMLQSSFVQLPNGFRKVIMAYDIQTQHFGTKGEAFDQNLSELIKGSRVTGTPWTTPSDTKFGHRFRRRCSPDCNEARLLAQPWDYSN